MKFVMCMEDMWVVQWHCLFEGLVEMREVVGVELYWKLIGKIMGVVCEVVRDRAEGGAGGALAPPLFCKNKNKLNKKII